MPSYDAQAIRSASTVASADAIARELDDHVSTRRDVDDRPERAELDSPGHDLAMETPLDTP